jgi:transcriptional regulator
LVEGGKVAGQALEIRAGTLELLALKALTWGPRHGYGILSTLRAGTQHELRIEDAALYPVLHRLEARGLIEAEWGLSENNRRARYYALTPEGRKALRAEAATWKRYITVVGRMLGAVEQPA